MGRLRHTPFAGPDQVLGYVGRYIHRIAIAHQRLLDLHHGHVRFRYTNYRHAGAARQQTMTLAATEFIRRVLLHVLPSGFHLIRYYGFLANCTRQQTLPQCRRLLQVPPPPTAERDAPVSTDYRDRYEALTGRSLRVCPHYQTGQMHVLECLVRTRERPAILDSS